MKEIKHAEFQTLAERMALEWQEETARATAAINEIGMQVGDTAEGEIIEMGPGVPIVVNIGTDSASLIELGDKLQQLENPTFRYKLERTHQVYRYVAINPERNGEIIAMDTIHNRVVSLDLNKCRVANEPQIKAYAAIELELTIYELQSDEGVPLSHILVGLGVTATKMRAKLNEIQKTRWESD